MTRHFLEVDDLGAGDVERVLDLAEDPDPPKVLASRSVALLFEKPSLRTRSATEVAVFQLGGHPLTLRSEEVGLATREPLPDVARVLSRYHAAIGARVFEHRKLEELATGSSVPVVNLLSDDGHPCQALADAVTLRRHFGRLHGLTIVYVGDFNNVARSLSLVAALSGMAMHVASPPGYGPTPADVERIGALGGTLLAATRPHDAVAGADVVYTDVWASMGKEEEAEERRLAFEGFTVDATLMRAASQHAVFLHCLPAHRGEEVTADVIDGPRSLVWEQAESRLAATRGLLLWLLDPKPAGPGRAGD
jgi:ornithine carbamoyltransferase